MREEQAAKKRQPTTSYDALGRLAGVTAPDGSLTDHNHFIVDSIVVGPYQRTSLAQVVDAQGHVVNRLYNTRGELVQVRNYTGAGSGSWADYAQTTYAYDWQGNLTTVTGALGNVTTMSYDVLGRKTGMSDPDMGSWNYTYDASGNLLTQEDAKDVTITFTYDALERVLTRKQGTTNLATYAYDTAANGIGRLHTVSWGATLGSDKDTFFYDSRGRLYKQTRLINGRGYTLETTAFDALDRPLTVKYPNDEVVHSTYDREGQNSLQVGGSGEGGVSLIGDVTYTARGQIALLDRATVFDTSYVYFGAGDAAGGGSGDSNYRLREMRHGGDGNDSKPDFIYTYDKVGNVLSMLADTNSSDDAQTFTYDHLDRLLAASATGGLANYSHSYSYNKIGNMMTYAGQAYAYTGWHTGCASHGSQPLPHAVRTVGGAGGDYFCYDANGNMSKRRQGGVTYNQGFDVENRLTSVQVVGGGTTTFEYDASGQRVKTVRPNGDTIYTPFPQYEEELRGAVSIQRRTYTLAGQAVAVQVSGDPVGGNNGVFYYLSDHLGSTSMLVNSSNGVTGGSTARYLPYGGWRTTPSQAISERAFTGQMENMELGLHYFNARYYVPGIGRFASADTIVPDPANPQSLNRYSYSYNNPVNYSDPSGHCVDGVTTWACIVAGVALTTKVIDYGMTVWDSYQAGRTLRNPAATQAERLMAGLTIGLSVAFEALEPDDILPVGLPADDVARRALLRRAEEALAEGGPEALEGFVRNSMGQHADEVLDAMWGALCCSGQRHHIFSSKIMRALDEHQVLRNVFQRDDIMVQALDSTSHRGYQTWHRAYDNEITEWLLDRPDATRDEFLRFLIEVYSRDDMLRRFPNGVEVLTDTFGN